MNKYETIFIIKNNLTEEQRNAVISKITDFIAKNGTITETTDMGSKKLAYEIRKHKEGYYYLIYFESEPETIYELERIYRITDEILKFLVIKK